MRSEAFRRLVIHCNLNIGGTISRGYAVSQWCYRPKDEWSFREGRVSSTAMDNYLRVLTKLGYLERLERGNYRIMREIPHVTYSYLLERANAVKDPIRP